MRSSTRRTILWALALVIGLVLAGVAFVRTADDAGSAADARNLPRPRVPDDPGDGCGEAAATDPGDLAVDRTLARCGPRAPAARPLARPVTVRVALVERTEAAAPLLVAKALGELEAENLTVVIVDLEAPEAYDALATGEVDAVVGGMDAPFFDAVHDGLGARLVLGGHVAGRPGDLATAQAGLWLRRDLVDADRGGNWGNVAGQTILVGGGVRAAATYPVDTLLADNGLGANAVDLVPARSAEALRLLQAAEVGGAWLAEPSASRAGADAALTLVATSPGSETIDGTAFGPRLLGRDRSVGRAYARAVIRTINTHLARGYTDRALAAVAAALGEDEATVAEGPAPLYDWEIRAGTTDRVQRVLTILGGVRYERAIAEADLVDRTIAAEAVGPAASG